MSETEPEVTTEAVEETPQEPPEGYEGSPPLGSEGWSQNPFAETQIVGVETISEEEAQELQGPQDAGAETGEFVLEAPERTVTVEEEPSQ